MKKLFLILILVIPFAACQNQRVRLGGNQNESNTLKVELFAKISGTSDSPERGPFNLESGDRLELSWEIKGEPDDCMVTGGGLNVNALIQNSVVTSALSTTTTFRLDCSRGPEEDSSTLRANVALPPLIAKLNGRLGAGSGAFGDGPLNIQSGGTVQLDWEISSDADTCMISSDKDPNFSWNAKTLVSPKTTPALTESTTFTLLCTRGSDEQSDSLNVVVTAPAVVISLVLSPATSHNFGTVAKDQAKYHDFTLTNNGNVAIHSIAGIANKDPFRFHDLAGCAGSLNPGASCTFTVRYLPTTTGTHSAILEIAFAWASGIDKFGVSLSGNVPSAPITIDNTYGTNGTLITNLVSGSVQGVALQPDGKMMVLSWISGGGPQLLRVTTLGAADTSFGGTGRVSLAPSFGYTGRGGGVAVQPNGKIVVVGSVGSSGAYAPFAMRLNADGTLDTTFASGGKWTGSLSGTSNDYHLKAVQIAPNGQIVALGMKGVSANSALIYRWDANGVGGLLADIPTLINSPNTGVSTPSSYPLSLAVDSLNRIIFSTHTWCNGVFDLLLVRLLANGTVDPAVGKKCVNAAPRSAHVQGPVFTYGEDAFILASNNAEVSTSKFFRLTSAGVLSAAWQVNFQARNGTMRADGKIVLYKNGAVLMDPNSGSILKRYDIPRGYGEHGAVQADNKVIFVGYTFDNPPTYQFEATRFLP